MTLRAPVARLALAVSALTLSGALLAGCAGTPSGAGGQPGSTGQPGSSSAGSAPASPSVPVVPGYAAGEFPPIPLFEVPDIGLMMSFDDRFALELERKIGTYPGLSIAPAQCGADGAYQSSGSTVLYGDGSGQSTGGGGSTANYGDGSGQTTMPNGWAVTNYGDGSGSLTGPGVSMTNYGDGSGAVTRGGETTTLYGDGSGSYTAPGVANTNHGDGSGQYTSGSVAITNYGDGSGQYTDGSVTIRNDGHGSAVVNGVTVPAEPLARVPKVGTLPPIDALKPITSCGLAITLESEALFDFDQATVRPDAQQVVSSLASALKDLAVPSAEIGGHTDSIGDDAYNQTLSEQRAQAVVSALQAAGVTTSLSAAGYGETRPVAPNENADASDNPAGRQLNRRVEIFVPTF